MKVSVVPKVVSFCNVRGSWFEASRQKDMVLYGKAPACWSTCAHVWKTAIDSNDYKVCEGCGRIQKKP